MDGTGAFSYFSSWTTRGVSIPARGVHGFLLRHLRPCRDFRFSEARVRAATLLGSGNRDAPKRSSVPLPFAGLRCLPPGRGGPLAPASSAPASDPLRGRSAHRTRIEAGRQDRLQTVCPCPAPAAPKRAMRILLLRKIVLLKPGSSRAWGWFQKDTLRVSSADCLVRRSAVKLP